MRLSLAILLSLVSVSGCATNSSTIPEPDTPTSAGILAPNRFTIDGILYVLTDQMVYQGIIGAMQGYAGSRPRLLGTIDGPTSGINSPLAATTDLHGNVFVSSGFGDSSCDTCAITEYTPNQYGDPAPIATVSKDVGQESGLAVDAAENIYAAGLVPGYKNAASAVYTFDHGRYYRSRILDHRFSGNGIALDSGGRIYLSTFGNGYKHNGAIEIFTPGAHGSSRPFATISGPKTRMLVPHGVAIDTAGDIYVAQNDATITVYAAGSTGNVAPIRVIAGKHTMLDIPHALSFDQRGNLFVYNGNIIVFAPGSKNDAAPIATYAAPPLQFGPTGMTVYPQLPPGP